MWIVWSVAWMIVALFAGWRTLTSEMLLESNTNVAAVPFVMAPFGAVALIPWLHH